MSENYAVGIWWPMNDLPRGREQGSPDSVLVTKPGLLPAERLARSLTNYGVLPFQIYQFLQDLVGGGDYARVRLEAALGNDQVGELL